MKHIPCEKIKMGAYAEKEHDCAIQIGPLKEKTTLNHNNEM